MVDIRGIGYGGDRDHAGDGEFPGHAGGDDESGEESASGVSCPAIFPLIVVENRMQLSFKANIAVFCSFSTRM